MPLSLDNRFNSVYRIVYRLLSSNQQHLRCISLPNLYDQQIKRNFPQFNGKLSVTNRCLFHTSKGKFAINLQVVILVVILFSF